MSSSENLTPAGHNCLQYHLSFWNCFGNTGRSTSGGEVLEKTKWLAEEEGRLQGLDTIMFKVALQTLQASGVWRWCLHRSEKDCANIFLKQRLVNNQELFFVCLFVCCCWFFIFFIFCYFLLNFDLPKNPQQTLPKKLWFAFSSTSRSSSHSVSVKEET